MSSPKFILSALEQFQCLASDCPEDCCSYNWFIPVEDNILEKWKNIPDPDLKEKVVSAVIDKEIKGKKIHFIGSEDRLCSLLDKQGLCTIHARLGPDYLCTTCREYPRSEVRHANHSVKSASMSCPEIARMIVEPEPGQNLFELEGSLAAIEEPASSINDFVNKVMNKKNHSVTAKIITISQFLIEISYLAQRGELDLARLQTLSRKVGKPMKDYERDIKSRHLKFDEETGGRFWAMVYRLITTRINYKQHDSMQNHPLIEKLMSKDVSTKFYSDLYKEINRLRLASSRVLSEQMKGIGERYLTVKFKSIGFPLAPPASNYIAAFLYGVLPYSFINLNLWILFDINKTISKQDIIKVMYRTERVVQHTERIYNAILDNHAILRIDEFGVCFSDIF